MTLPDIIKAKGLKKEFVIKQSGVPRNRFYCNQLKLYKFSLDELGKIADAVNVDINILNEIALKKK